MSFIVVGIAAGAAALVSVGTAAIGAKSQQNKADDAADAASRAQRKIDQLVKDRQVITNPYSGVQDLSYLSSDATKNVGNPYAALGVATQAAEIQMEQSDIALANTLDTLAATGASAGGATALAQAALKSKKDVASNIEQQEVANEKLAAQGQMQLDQMRISEQQRLQGIAISEGQRVQSSEAQGQIYEFEKNEARTNMDLNRAAGLQNQNMQMEANANSNKAALWGGAIGAVGNIGGSVVGALPTG